MTNTSSTVLAVGAAGKFAGLVVPALVQRGAVVRGLVKNVHEEGVARARGATQVTTGDLADEAHIEAAMKDVSSVFYIAPAFLPNEAKVGRAVVAAAKKAGVRRFVFSSVIHPILSALENHAAKGPVEEAVLDSGMEFTFLHPTLFFQNFAASWDSTVSSRVLAEPWSTESRFSRVDYRDVAEVAAIALTEDRLLNGTFELCAEGTLNRDDVAALIGEVLGHGVAAKRIDPATLGPDSARMLPMFEHYDRQGLLGNSLTLASILGREPRTLRAYFEELAVSHAKES